tara:strand:+ start:11867 stop:12904 length:1038 start_codon:yes stop_codon:yes gene_type:complete
MEFKAAILIENKKPLEIDYINFNKLDYGQVLVKIKKSGVCRSQLFEIDGERGLDKWIPHLLGHEAVGMVVDIGKGVSKVNKGDMVILTWIKSKGISAKPATYKWNKTIVNSGKVTTFNEYSVCSEDRLVKFNDQRIEYIGPSIGCAMATGFGLAMTLPDINEAEFVAVIGLGGIGMSSLLSASMHSNAKLIGIDLNQNRLNEAKTILKNVKFINPKELNINREIEQITNGQMLDVVIESSGNINALNQSIDLINNQGIVKFATHPRNGDFLKINPFELIKGKRIEGSWGGDINPDEDLIKIINKIYNKKKFVNLFTEKVYKLHQINKAIDDMRLGKVLRPIIDME